MKKFISILENGELEVTSSPAGVTALEFNDNNIDERRSILISLFCHKNFFIKSDAIVRFNEKVNEKDALWHERSYYLFGLQGKLDNDEEYKFRHGSDKKFVWVDITKHYARWSLEEQPSWTMIDMITAPSYLLNLLSELTETVSVSSMSSLLDDLRFGIAPFMFKYELEYRNCHLYTKSGREIDIDIESLTSEIFFHSLNNKN